MARKKKKGIGFRAIRRRVTRLALWGGVLLLLAALYAGSLLGRDPP